ncbi:ADP-ribosylglycohydrolase family protein [Microbacterium sp. JAI119]|uniref:ADP-ribosylglycohydrolase family protein n=1 Tax=Microbacterium sp. JAI119 TaxID=2723062 RepID=UPI0015CE5DB4|nr:ADP-ribosylglycohydrolase family protein [Microbacterium sp. JAI119]NYF28084.1 ADP-ribosylglycohydrolase [Microbacterium sp. JAI119]
MLAHTDDTGPFKDRVAGGLAATLLGDALGSVTEQLTVRQVRERYGRVTTLLAPAEGTFADGREPGELTDDGLLTLSVLRQLAAGSGEIEPIDVARLLLEWASDPELLSRFAGPSSRKAIHLLRGGATPSEAGAPDPLTNDLRTSNGAAMKVAPAGWAFPGDLVGAARTATKICVTTHNSDIAYAGAAAVAGAVSAATSSSSTTEIAHAAVTAARIGYDFARVHAIEVPGPSITTRIELACDIATAGSAIEVRIRRLGEIFGSGLPITEAVPMAIGMFVAMPDEPLDLLLKIVNLGGDSDTVAAIAGAISGTYQGFDALPADMVRTLEAANHIDIRAEASLFVDVIARRRAKESLA